MKVKLQLKDKPDSIANISLGYVEYQGIFFFLFDLTNPETFKRKDAKSSYDRIDIAWLRNEAFNNVKNPQVTEFLVGTNSDKANQFDKELARKYADENGMIYKELNCLNTKECQNLMKEAITLVCYNITSQKYIWNESART